MLYIHRLKACDKFFTFLFTVCLLIDTLCRFSHFKESRYYTGGGKYPCSHRECTSHYNAPVPSLSTQTPMEGGVWASGWGESVSVECYMRIPVYVHVDATRNLLRFYILLAHTKSPAKSCYVFV